MASPDAYPGFFGKLVSRGDFVRRRLPDAFVACWDEWLQCALEASRLQLCADWLPSYLSAPIWRFALGIGVCEYAPWVGVLMPSVDRVGRHFPLTIAAAADPFRHDVQQLSGAGGWFDALEHLALSTLREEFTLDDLDAALLGLPMPQAGETALRIHLPIPDAAGMASALPSISAALTRLAPAHHSLWWTDGSPRVAPSLFACRGLPDPSAFAAMMTGAWEQEQGAPAQAE